MKTLSKINEITHWGKAIKRSQSDEVRKEDDPKVIIRSFMEKIEVSEEKYKINDDNSVDVNDAVTIYPEDVPDGKLPIKFRNVAGDFDVYDCHLVTLENSPEYVGGNFCCSHNDLESLEGCPKIVGGDFQCSSNKWQFTIDDVKTLCKVRKDIYVKFL